MSASNEAISHRMQIHLLICSQKNAIPNLIAMPFSSYGDETRRLQYKCFI